MGGGPAATRLLAPRFHPLAMRNRAALDPGRLFSDGRRIGYVGGLGGRERLTQAIDGAGQVSDLLGQLLGLGLLRGKEASDGLQLILNDLQLVDRFLLGRFSPWFLHQLLGSAVRACNCRTATTRSGSGEAPV